MSIFGGRAKVRGLANEPIPDDPNEGVVDEIYASYPFGGEGIGIRSFVRMIVHVVLEMKKRGLI